MPKHGVAVLLAEAIGTFALTFSGILSISGARIGDPEERGEP